MTKYKTDPNRQKLERDEFYARRLNELADKDDIETCHIKADWILCEVLLALGYKNTVEAFNNLQKWYA